MADRIKKTEKTRTFTTIPIVIHKKISICGDKVYENIWKDFFEDKKVISYLKKWILEDYIKLGYDVETFEDIFEEDEDLKMLIDNAITKMFIKLNKIPFPDLNIKSKQEYIKYKVEQEVNKRDDKQQNT